MAYCGPKGIPLSTFLKWSESDQQAALAWQGHEARRHSCGTHPEDWADPTGRPVEAVHYVEQICRGCQVLQAAQERLEAGRDRTRGLGLVAHHGPRAGCTSCTAHH
jgi:hypothetical protein